MQDACSNWRQSFSLSPSKQARYETLWVCVRVCYSECVQTKRSRASLARGNWLPRSEEERKGNVPRRNEQRFFKLSSPLNGCSRKDASAKESVAMPSGPLSLLLIDWVLLPCCGLTACHRVNQPHTTQSPTTILFCILFSFRRLHPTPLPPYSSHITTAFLPHSPIYIFF